MVLGIEARGFIFAPALAYALGAGFVPVRKPKKLPAECVSVTYDLEYGTDTLEMHRDAIGAGSRVLIVDDLLATGGTAAAAARLVREAGGTVVGLGFVVELTFLKGRGKLAGNDVFSLLAVRQMTRADGQTRAVPACARWPKSIWICACWASARTAITSCAPSSRPSRWPTPSTSPSRRGGRTAVELRDPLAIPDNLVVRAAHLALEAMRATGGWKCG